MINEQIESRKWRTKSIVVILVMGAAFFADRTYCFDYNVEIDRKKLALDCERVINFYRHYHQASELKHSNVLEEYAIERIGEMTPDQMGPLRRPPYGETALYSKFTPTNDDCSRFMFSLYKDYYNFDFSISEEDSPISHFTQLVWNSTSTIGCATENQFFVCAYQPPGNVKGYVKENVFQRST